MTGMPDIPGLRMKIIPKDHKAILYDPLEDDPDRIARINRVAERARAIYKGAPFTFVPASEFELNPDMLKTLLIELNRKVDTRCCVVVDGTLPGLDDIAKLDGRQLYDPWNNGRKPTYVDEVDDWMGRLDEQQV